MEEILASIRRIIADEDGGKTGKAGEPAEVKQATRAPSPRAATGNSQDDIDAMLAVLDEPAPAPPAPKAKAPAAKPEPVKPEPAKPAATQPAPEVLMLTEAMTAQPAQPPSPPAQPKPPGFRTIDASSDVVFTDKQQEQPAPPPPVAEEPRRPPPAQMPAAVLDAGLVSSATAAAVDGAFNSLAQTVIGQNARTLEDLVREMLRPILKNWLDDNLPGLVERIVRAEIERVARGR